MLTLEGTGRGDARQPVAGDGFRREGAGVERWATGSGVGGQVVEQILGNRRVQRRVVPEMRSSDPMRRSQSCAGSSPGW